MDRFQHCSAYYAFTPVSVSAAFRRRSRHGRYMMTMMNTVWRNACSPYNYGSVGPGMLAIDLWGPKTLAVNLWGPIPVHSPLLLTLLVFSCPDFLSFRIQCELQCWTFFWILNLSDVRATSL